MEAKKARVALARVLLEQSDLVLLDEPFAGLDRSTRIQMAALCQTLLASKTVILVTHDPRDAQDWLDTAMVLTTESIKGPYRLNEFASDRALIRAGRRPMNRLLSATFPFLLLVGLWWLVVVTLEVPHFILPSPERVARVLVERLPLISGHAFTTASEIVCGLCWALCSVLLSHA